jgi:hypothetical protein
MNRWLIPARFFIPSRIRQNISQWNCYFVSDP